MNDATKRNYKKTLKSINTKGVISEKEINRRKNALSRDYSEMSDLLYANNFRDVYDLTNEQKQKGINYLLKAHLKANGEQRKTSNIDYDFLEMIKQVRNGANYDFVFQGFKGLTNGYWRFYAPIYTLMVNNETYSYFHFNGRDYNADTYRVNNYVYAYDY